MSLTMSYDREKRSERILKMVDEDEFVSVQTLMQKLQVSHMTVRRDLEILAEKGLLLRTYGGAAKSAATTSLFSFDRRVNMNRLNKEAVCRAGARYIEEGDTIFIDCGTTLFRLVHYLAALRNLRVITNSLPVVSELLVYPGVTVNFVGGEIDHDRRAAYGPKAEAAICEYHADKAFVGADGISIENGLSSYDEKEGNITRRIAENADTVFLLCDSSKVEHDSFSRFAPLSLVNYLVTDRSLPAAVSERYEAMGIRVVDE